MGRERTSYSLSCCSSTKVALRLSFCISRVSCANVRAEDSRAGSAESKESSEDERVFKDDDSVDVVECNDRNVGYEV